jgi:osmoprotectant transport system permease protein
MIRANARVVLQKESAGQAAADLLSEALGAEAPVGAALRPDVAGEIARDTARHLQIVALSLAAAVLVGVPLGVLATRSRLLAAAALSGAGLLQTIPSLALLAFLIPLFGIGLAPALVALFLYSLLPIVRNTYTGLTTIPPQLDEAAVHARTSAISSAVARMAGAVCGIIVVPRVTANANASTSNKAHPPTPHPAVPVRT